MRASDAVSPETLVTYLNLPVVRQQVQRYVRGQSAHLYTRDVQALPVPIVPREVQDEVRGRLTEAYAHRNRAAQLAREAFSCVEALILGR